MKKSFNEEDKKLLKKFSKEELFRIVKTQDNKILRLEREYRGALKIIASYRTIFQCELRNTSDFWETIGDEMIAENTEDTPPDFKEPVMKSSKKKDKGLEGYS